jgi:hypothetical protein
MRISAESLLVIIRHRLPLGRQNVDPSATLRLADRVDTIGRVRGAGRGQTLVWRDAPPPPSQWLLENPLAAEDQAVLFRDGWVAVAFGDPYRVEWITPAGSRVRTRPLAIERVEVDDRMKRAIIAWRWPMVKPPFSPNELPPWPALLPPFLNAALLTAPDGSLVIRRAYNPLAPRTLYDVVDRAGELNRRISLPENDRIVGFGTRSVYTVTKDTDGVERLQRHPWP